jgi:hypothetical protein
VSSSKLAWGLAAADVLMIVISVLMGTRFYLRHMSALTLIVIVLMFAIGVGLIIAGGVGKRK